MARTLLLANLLFAFGCIYLANATPLYSTEAALVQSRTKDENGAYILRPYETPIDRYEHAAVATSSKQCAQVGTKLLRKGGSAVDAAIGTLLCDGIVSMQGLGIGGGFLMTIWDAEKKQAHFFDAREYAPAAAHETMFNNGNKEGSKYGANAIGVPGEVAGYYEAHKKFGKLPWADLFEDVISLCRNGLTISRYVANDIKKVANDIQDPKFKPLKKLLLSPERSGRLIDAGEKLHREKLLATLILIRDNGASIFYNGSIAENLVNEIQSAGGVMTLEDFKNYKPKWKTPVSTSIKGKTLYSAPTPGSGAVLAFMLKVLEDLIPAPSNEIMWQRIAETFKWGYARRNELGDFVDRPQYLEKKTKEECKVAPEEEEEMLKNRYTFTVRGEDKWDKDCLMSVAFRNLLSEEYAARVRDLIEDDKTYDYEHYNITAEGRIDLGTAHTSVYAADGSAVSVTSTINHLFGSLFLSESTGIILNNEMDDYSYPGITSGFGIEPSEFNFVRNRSADYLRPMSSMAPTIILNDDQTVRLIIGSAGGTKITTGVAQGIIWNLFLDKDIKYSLDHPRIHHNLWPMAVQAEDNFNTSILKHLKENVGHDIEKWLIMQNTMAAVAVNSPHNITASGDYRREGGTDGY